MVGPSWPGPADSVQGDLAYTGHCCTKNRFNVKGQGQSDLEIILIKSNGLHFKSEISFLNVSDSVYNLSHRESRASESCFIIKRENVTATSRR